MVAEAEMRVGALSVTLYREELKTAGLLCPLSTTLKSRMSPPAEKYRVSKTQHTQEWDYPLPTVAVLLRVEMATVWCWPHVVTGFRGPAPLSNGWSAPQLT